MHYLSCVRVVLLVYVHWENKSLYLCPTCSTRLPVPEELTTLIIFLNITSRIASTKQGSTWHNIMQYAVVMCGFAAIS